MELLGIFLEILPDFSSDTQQRVVVDGVFSYSKPVVSGVPKGKFLGTLLYLVYTNYMVVDFENNIDQYADDATLAAMIKSPESRG